MKSIRTLMFASAAVACLATAMPARAGSDYVVANVNDALMTADGSFGGCMAWLSVSPSTKLPACAADFVTFDCDGKFGTDQVRAYRLFDQAQMALAANKTVVVFFQDDKTQNGYCFAYRIDVMR